MRKALLMLALVLCGINVLATTGHADEIVGVAAYWSSAFALTKSGDVYSTTDLRAHPLQWTFVVNIPSSSGTGVGAQFASIAASPSGGGPLRVWAITSEGDAFGPSASGKGWEFRGNICELAGRSLGSGHFTDISWESWAVGFVACTSTGDTYRIVFSGGTVPCESAWCFAGNVFGAATDESGATWGAVKARYR